MKPCVHCGRALPDEANFCRSCGKKQTEPKNDNPSTPQTAERRQRLQQPSAPEQSAKKPSASKKRRIILAVVLGILVAAGLFAYRAMKPPRALRWYDENHHLIEVQYFDSRGRQEREEHYLENGEISYIEEYRMTEGCEDIDTSEVEDRDGVKNVEVRQCFFASDDEEPSETQNYVVFGYDWRGRLLVKCYYYYDTYDTEAEEWYLAAIEAYDLDFFGNWEHEIVRLGDGTILWEEWNDNTYRFGRVVSAEATIESSDNGTSALSLKYVY